MKLTHFLLSSALLLLLCPPASGDSQILVVPNPTTPQPNAPKARAYYPLIWHGDGDFFMSLKGVDMSQVHVRVDAEKDARELTAKAITCLKEAGIYKEPVADPALSLIVDLSTHRADPGDDSDDPKAPVYGQTPSPEDPYRGLFPPPVPLPPEATRVQPPHVVSPEEAQRARPAPLPPVTKEQLRQMREDRRRALLRQPICPPEPKETEEQVQARVDKMRRGELPLPHVQTPQEHQQWLKTHVPCMDQEFRDGSLQQLDEIERREKATQ